MRALEPNDISDLYNWENNTDIWQVSNTVAPISKHALEQYIETSSYDIYTTRQLRMVIENNKGLLVGCIDLFDFDPNNRRAGVGVLIDNPANRNKGYASEALDLLISYAFETLGLHQLYCNVADDNEASLQLFKKFDFEIIGLKKQWMRNGGGWTNEYMLQLINEAG